ncbi:MAG: MerR family transcriptional regulator [Bacteroidetes bacterium]|nr:MerR family transcriptional regulator [Bacteroidota bacterium]
MEKYQINDLERLTGIKAHTIRIWEKRYNLIEPHRTATNIRYYDDSQLKKILNVSTLLESGYKISKVAVLNDDEMNKKVQAVQENSSEDVANNAYVSDLIISMLAYDEAGFEKIFSAVVLRYGLYDAMLNVIYPFLAKTGILWVSNKAMPSQEHFASSLIRRKLQAAIDGLAAPSKPEKIFLLYLPDDEWHELSLVFSDYLIRKSGYKTIYLGQNVPAKNLDELVKKIKPTHALTFNISRKKPTDVQNHIAAIKSIISKFPF